MIEKWIGKEVNTGGSYYGTNICSELRKRHGGQINAEKLYKFKSRFGNEYNITDEEVIVSIERLIGEDKSTELVEYLYNLIIEKFGVIEFIVGIGHKMAAERDKGYRNGKERMQADMRQLLGLE